MQNIYLSDISEFVGEREFFLTVLTEKERERITGYKDANAKLRSLVGSVMISAFTGKGDILYGEYGKPYITGAPFFNLSHSGDSVVLFVCDDAEVGIDIETIRPISEKIAEKIFTEKERIYAKEIFSAEIAYIALWTIKESAAKCVGRGIISPKKQAIDLINENSFRFGGKKIYYKCFFVGDKVVTACSTAHITADIKKTLASAIKSRLT